MTAGHGILTLAQVITGELEELLTRRANQEKILRDFIEEQELSAFPAVVVAPTLVEGMQALVQCHGLGGFQPNTVLIGWSDDSERSVVFGSLLRTLLALNRSIVILRCEEEDQDPWIAPPGSVDVWWRGKKNGALMLLLAHLLIQNTPWQTRNIRLLRMISAEAGREETTQHLKELIESSRIDATPVVIVAEDVSEAIRSTSSEAAVVFLGFEPPAVGEEKLFLETMNRLVEGLPTVIFASSAGGIDLEA